jgi:Bifunctional DNA primase/polymerase, N-terminal
LALVYAELGWRVFPVVPGGKRPLQRGWQSDATTDPTQIERYWRSRPTPNIGIVCGEAFDAFDIEAAHLPALRAWTEDHGLSLPLTPLARTGRGGIHLLVEPTGTGGGRDLFLDGVHIGELKSTGGFIVVAPSVTEGPYRWLRSPDETPLADTPSWLLDLLKRPSTRRSSPPTNRADPARRRRQLDALAEAIANAGTGRRNKYLYWAMRRAAEEGVPALEAARTLGRSALDAGLDEREVTATLRSAQRVTER